MVDLALFRSRVFSGGTATLVLLEFGVLEMMNGMYGIGVAMMIYGAAAALAVITLAVLAAGWLARDLGSGERSGGRQP
ncbi:MAG TPA: hypothetical protein VF951_04200 [Streptosporangiaceae bacterium]|nr:hypothetical protein [Streptosporangiaceae bacterium]